MQNSNDTNNEKNPNYDFGTGTYSYGQGEYSPQINYKTEKSTKFGKGVVFGVFCTLFAMLCIVAVSLFVGDDGESHDDAPSFNNLTGVLSGEESFFSEEEIEKLQNIQEWISYYSYYEQDKEKFIDAVYESLLGSLEDDYSAYYDEEAYKSLTTSSEGIYSGIGCVVTQDVTTGYVKVVQPYEGSPAYDAGIAIGDIIYKADGVELTGMDLNEAVTYLLGEEGTTVEVTYIHDGEEITVDIERRKIEVPTVEYEMLEDNIGYILITEFEELTMSQFKNAVDKLIADGAKGFVFDVRSNPGGMYDTVVDMLDMLLPEGTIVYTEDKYGNQEVETSDEKCLDMPMAVLINGNSASASEIFAGALQDYDAAEIIGTQSFGKGIVQSIIPLGDGTAIKFTIASYFTPKGVCIHGVGITPDQVVELPTDKEAYDDNGYLKDEYDTQLEAAKEYINNKTK